MTNKKLLSIFDKSSGVPSIPPIWLMRQAGRYLDEYRVVRKRAGSFLELCYNPALAREVTLQPIKRFGFDGAILFADILLIPQALGQELWFVDGEGPRLTPIKNADNLELDKIHDVLAPIYQTIKNLSMSLPKETTLIGFAGAPWTVATYMIAGRGEANLTRPHASAHDLYQNDPRAFEAILDVLVTATTDYLERQVLAGAHCLQIFDSWAGSLSGKYLEKYCFEPNAQIVKNLRARGIKVPIIGFARGIGEAVIDFVDAVPVQGVSLDQSMDMEWAAANVPENIVLQGNLDPMVLVAGGQTLKTAIDDILAKMSGGTTGAMGRRHIFNLGHGIVPQTPPEHVAQLVRHIRGV